MKQKLPPGVYCEVFGMTARNKVLEYTLCYENSDFAMSEVAEDIALSRPKIYQLVDSFLKKGYFLKSRKYGKTQLYKLNKENPEVKVMLKAFKACLQLVVDEYAPKKHENGKVAIVASAKSF